MDPIQQLVSEGRKESSGSFTMDLLAAHRKLTKVAQLEPGLMLGKIIQAAVVARAVQVRFAVSASDIQAKINFPETARTDQEVQEHMATAFALAQGLKPRELSWACGGETRRFTGRDTGHGPLRTEGLAVFRFEGRYPSLWEEVRSWIVARRDAACLLRERAFLCPIPVFLDACRVNSPELAGIRPGCEVVQLTLRGGLARDRVIGPSPFAAQAQRVHIAGETYQGRNSFARPVDPRHPPKLFIFEGAAKPEVQWRTLRGEEQYATAPSRAARDLGGVVLCNVIHSSGEIALASDQVEWHNPHPYLSPDTSLASYSPSFCARRWISIFDNQNSPSELWPIQDGLLLNKLPLPRCVPGCRVILPANEINLDLDQLSMQQDEVFHALQEELVPELARLRALWDELRESGKRATTL
ncbi:hypothetical protein JST97_11815 [bacterium]|nr:hypothetical protein [bacterium]